MQITLAALEVLQSNPAIKLPEELRGKNRK
jgi:hypothetical protein